MIPKLILIDPQGDLLDQFLESVDLSTYGLQRTKLGHTIELDDTDAEVDPQNPNPRSAHGSDEQRVKFISILKYVQQQPNYQTHVVENKDVQTRELALQKMINDAVNQQRKSELELYKLYSQDTAFKQAMQDTRQRMLSI